MKYTNLVQRATRRMRGSKRGFDDDSDKSDHSSDSGLELDHTAEVQLATRSPGKGVPYTYEEESNAEYCFPSMPGRGRGVASPPPAPLTSQLPSSSRDGRVSLTIVSQPEQQHRARYQTEGSRGAVKDRTGNGFPMVKLTGYDRATTLQIFVATDVGRVAPHMFYQACRVSGKNSTPCVERKLEGTVVIEVDLDPGKEMLVTCDCVGILKERNVDVEHRFPDQLASRNKKKSTRCRMVFRTFIHSQDGSIETLQVCSQPIVCTQPPGIPEICKRSLTSCPASGGLELFILGKNFLKDTRVVFQNTDVHPQWEETVMPDKEFLQQTHLVCVVPPYRNRDISSSVNVKVFVTSSGKASDPHQFVYLPDSSSKNQNSTPMDTQPSTSFMNSSPAMPAFFTGAHVVANGRGLQEARWPSTKTEPCHDEDTMMPPPHMSLRRLSFLQPSEDLKAEIKDESQSMSVDGESQPVPEAGVDLSIKAFAPLLTPAAYRPEPGPFPTLYEHVPQSFVDYSGLQPPPSKMQAREATNGEAAGSGRVRSGSFSHSPLTEVSVSAFDTTTRTRSASVSLVGNKPSLFSGNSLMTPVVPFASSLPSKHLDSAMAAKQTSLDLRRSFGNLPEPVASEVTRSHLLDVLVNSAAEDHMTPVVSMNDSLPVSVVTMSYPAEKSPSFQPSPEQFSSTPPQNEFYSDVSMTAPGIFPSDQCPVPPEAPSTELYPSTQAMYASPPGNPEAFAPSTSAEMYPSPVAEAATSAEIFQAAPAQNGVAPDDMVKMSDNELLSYLNSNAFDQGIDSFFNDLMCGDFNESPMQQDTAKYSVVLRTRVQHVDRCAQHRFEEGEQRSVDW